MPGLSWAGVRPLSRLRRGTAAAPMTRTVAVGVVVVVAAMVVAAMVVAALAVAMTADGAGAAPHDRGSWLASTLAWLVDEVVGWLMIIQDEAAGWTWA